MNSASPLPRPAKLARQSSAVEILHNARQRILDARLEAVEGIVLFLMHKNASDAQHNRGDEWAAYLAKLRQVGAFRGGSAIGDGVCMSKSGTPPGITPHLSGYIRVQAESLPRARELVQGNPVFEAGGTVEVRELPKA